jgi:tripartite-type tricarboxylate transporter receptor subunit TctC
MRVIAGVLALSGLVLSGIAGAPMARAADDNFYKGKSVNLVIGYSVGGGYDLYARLLARHLGRFIPGNPTVLPQNMPGAGSLKAVEYLMAVAPKDGTVIGTFGRTIPLSPLLEGATFDPQRLEWIGSITSDTSVCVTSSAAPIQKWTDMETKVFTAGGEGKGADPDIFANIIRNVFGYKVKLVTGYPGTAEMMLATLRGEIDGLCGMSYSSLRARHLDLLQQKKLNIIVQASLKKDPALPDVPLMIDLGSGDIQKQALRLLLAAQVMARPFAMPPGTPKDRADIIRNAFVQTMKDPAYLEDSQKAGLDVDPMTGAQLSDLLKQLYATPADVVKQAASVIKD